MMEWVIKMNNVVFMEDIMRMKKIKIYKEELKIIAKAMVLNLMEKLNYGEASNEICN